MAQSRKVGVLLINTGTPDAPHPREVRSYLDRFLSDPRIVPMNRVAWWFILHLFVLPKRGRTSAAKYETIWTEEGSPFVLIHQALTAALEARLQENDCDVVVRYAMSYSAPFISDALCELEHLGCARIVVLPLYPQAAYSTVGAVSDGVERAKSKLTRAMPIEIIHGYHDNPSYIKAIAASIRYAGFGEEEGDRLIMSYHSIPLADIDAGDDYELATGATSLMVASELNLERKCWTISYQCRFDKSRTWLSPYTKDVLTRRAEVGSGRTFIVCPIFPVDCLETLYDVKQEFKQHYFDCMQAAGNNVSETDFVYVPCLNKSRAHVRVLADVLAPYLMREEQE